MGDGVPAVQRRIGEWARSDSASRREKAAAHRDSPAHIVAGLAADESRRVAAAAAQNPNCPEATLRSMAAGELFPAGRLQAEAAANPACPPGDLERLSRSRDPQTRAAVAANPSPPGEALDLLSWDEDEATRLLVAGNPSASPGVLDRLAGGEPPPGDIEELRFAVAGNPNAPAWLLDRIASEGGTSARERVARHAHAGAGALGIIVETSLASGEYGADIAAALARDHCPPQALARAACDPASPFWARRAAMAHPALPAEARTRAEADPFSCSRVESVEERTKPSRLRPDRSGRTADRGREKVYRAEHAWQQMPPPQNPLAADAILAAAVLADPALLARYPHTADWPPPHEWMVFPPPPRTGRPDPSGPTGIIGGSAPRKVRTAGGYWEETGKVKIVEGYGAIGVVLHEIAHKLVDEDRRHQGQRPRPASHGPDFTAAMLDLVEAGCGQQQRAALRGCYEQAKAPLDRADLPLAAGGALPAAVWAARPVPARPPCGRIVAATGRPCLLTATHKGRCRSRLRSP